MSDQRPFCAEHPDRLSAGTCARCGRFACEACFHPATGRCTTCHARTADPLGVRAAPFSVGQVLASAAKLARTALPTVIGVSLTMVLSGYLVNTLRPFAPELVARGHTLLTIARTLMVGTFLHGVLLAQMAGAAQGETVSVPEAMGRSASAYGRMFWGQLVSLGAVALGSLACGVPGIIAAVVFWLVLPAAYLEPDRPATQVSVELTRNQRWPVFALLLLSRIIIIGTVAVPYVLRVTLLESGLPTEHMTMVFWVAGLGVDLVRELVESFTVAMTLAAYLRLRYAAELALEGDVTLLAA